MGDSKRRGWTKGGRTAWAVSIFIVAFGLGAGPAWAHNSLVAATPAKDAVLTAAPPEVTLKFLATLQAGDANLTVTGAQGGSAIGPVIIDGKTITAPFTADASGTYEVSYDVMSTDGHPVRGSYTFTLRLPSPSASPAAAVATATELTADSPSPVARQDAPGSSTTWWPYAAGLVIVLVAGGVFALRRRARP